MMGLLSPGRPGPSQIIHIPGRVERIEPDCLLHLVDGLFRLTDIDEEITHVREKVRVVGIQVSSAQVTGHRLLVLPVVERCPFPAFLGVPFTVGAISPRHAPQITRGPIFLRPSLLQVPS